MSTDRPETPRHLSDDQARRTFARLLHGVLHAAGAPKIESVADACHVASRKLRYWYDDLAGETDPRMPAHKLLLVPSTTFDAVISALVAARTVLYSNDRPKRALFAQVLTALKSTSGLCASLADKLADGTLTRAERDVLLAEIRAHRAEIDSAEAALVADGMLRRDGEGVL